MGFPGSSASKESTCNAGDPGSIPGSGRSAEEGIGYPLQYFCLEHPHEQRSLAGYSPWGRKESDTTKQLSIVQHSMYIYWGFLGSSTGKESTCNAGDPGSIPWSGRSPAEGISYPLQYSWTSLVAQLAKNPPAMQEIPVRFLGWKIHWRRDRLPASSIPELPLWLSW